MRNIELTADNLGEAKKMVSSSYEDSSNGIYNKYNYWSIVPKNMSEPALFGIQRLRPPQSMHELYGARMNGWSCGMNVEDPTSTYESRLHDAKSSREVSEGSVDEIIVIPLRDISYEESKKLISDYIKSAGEKKVYMSDIAVDLKISLRMIIRAFKELGID
ncbi:hypothetical protein [Methanothrix sp.]|jgi:hypothetical protein|uniref:hypothetical protein n=1 Tax=Methanothrix sp. TaxID=90426 RepID=UPI00329807CC